MEGGGEGVSKNRTYRLKYLVHMHWWTEEVITLSMAGYPKANVPCGECHACCINSAVDVDYEVRAGVKYRTRKDKDGKYLLQHRRDKSCVYLSKNGCSLEHSKKPGICRAFDCRASWCQAGFPTNHPIWEVVEQKFGKKENT